MILETAFAMQRTAGPFPFDGVGNGVAADAYSTITGRTTTILANANENAGRALIPQIQDALASGHQVMLSTNPDATTLFGSHVYLVISISQTQIVLVNPLTKNKSNANALQTLVIGEQLYTDLRQFIICK